MDNLDARTIFSSSCLLLLGFTNKVLLYHPLLLVVDHSNSAEPTDNCMDCGHTEQNTRGGRKPEKKAKATSGDPSSEWKD